MKPPFYWPRILRELRTEHGLSIRALAARAGVARTTVIVAEQRGSVTVTTLEKLLHALGYELDAIKHEVQ